MSAGSKNITESGRKLAQLSFTSTLINDLGWFINLRWIAVLGVTVFAFLLRFLSYNYYFFIPCIVVAFLIAIANILYFILHRFLKKRKPGKSFQEKAFASLQVGMDWIFLTVLAFYTGGVISPFLFFFVFHIIISAILLPRIECYFQAGFAIILVGLLLLLDMYGVIPNHPLIANYNISVEKNYLHIALFYMFFSFMLIISSFFATTFSGRLRKKNEELNILKRDLETAIAKLKSQDEVLLDLTNKTAHELRAPLTAIQSILNTILQGYSGDIPDDLKDMLKRVENRANSLIKMTTELLDLARKREISVKENREIKINQILENVFNLFKKQAETKEISYKLKLTSEMLTINAREEDVYLLFSNLIENAIKYTPKRKSVTVELERHNESARIIVSDTGIGIPPESRFRIFDRFYRAPNARNMEALGTGLGLALVKRIVDSYNGTIIFASEEGEGTTFTIMLPLKN